MPINTELLNQKIRFYNRIYRWALMFLMLVIMTACIIGVRQVFVTTNRVDDSTAQIKKSIACIVTLFTQPNRANITIDNINNCTLVRR